jgi:hypothetical protein
MSSAPEYSITQKHKDNWGEDKDAKDNKNIFLLRQIG